MTELRKGLALLLALLAWAGNVAADSLVPAGATWRYFKGTTNPSPDDPAAWRMPDFGDSGWLSGPEPIFYGEPLEGTELPDMRGNYTSVYFRQTFDVASPADLASVTLKVLSDDGFVAWINGQEIARFNVPEGELDNFAVANGTFAEPLSVEEYPVGNPGAVIRAGRNVLAIHGFNASLNGSSDFVLNVSLDATVDNAPPVVERLLPSPGAVVRSLTSLEIQFSRPVQGVDAADLLVNGVPATDRTEFAPGQFLFSLPAVGSGTVNVKFRDDHGITDQAATPHPFAGGSWSFTVDPDVQSPGVIVNEFMADNDHTLRDEDGDTVDWVELLNTDTQATSLTGWYLTDEVAKPKKWRFPPVSLPAKGFLVVYASGKNRTNDTTHLHTSFKLSDKAGGYLALVNAAGEVVSAIEDYPVQHGDISYGRAPGAPNLVGYFVDPTPGKPNTAYGTGFAPPIQFSAASQTFQEVLTLTLTATNPAAVIRYTTNGALPALDSFVYSGPLQITNAVQIRAQAFVDGLLPGPIRSETFVPLSTSVAAFTSDLPVMLIHDFNRGRPSANTDFYASIQLYEPDTNGVTSLTNPPSLSTRAVIAARGSSTEGYSKVSLKVEFQDELGFGRDLSPLGLPAESDWVLYAPNNFEPILIHNPFAHQLSRDIGRYSPRTRFVEVYLVQRGFGPVASSSYAGIYVLEEKIKLGKDRVDAPKLYSGQNTAPAVTGGYLMKIDRPDPGDGGFYAAGQGILYVSPKEEEIYLPDRSGQRDYLQQYMDRFGNALYGGQFRDPTNGYRAFIDVGSWIDHHLLNVLTFNVDALRLSAYFYKQRDGKLHFGPLWDFDRALYSTDGRDSNARVWRSRVSDMGTDFFNYPWWGQLFSDPDFFQDYIDRYQELRRGAFSPTNLARLVEDLSSQVRKAQPREQSKWGVTPRGGYAGEVRSLKYWLSNRVDFIDTQFVKPPTFATPGGTVPAGFELVINAPTNASIYYTLDGTDPRKRGTATGDDVGSNARLYSGPIVVNANSRVFARARNPLHTALTGPDNPPLKSIWSGPIVDTYVVNPIPIRLTEIMFHPVGDGPGTGFEDEDFEFLELQNFGPNSIDLTGLKLEGTVDFAFPETNAVRSIAAGARILLVGNRAAFARRYPAAGIVAGEFKNRLDNNGGRLALFGSLREPIFDFRYADDWQAAADGAGPSLVLREEADGALPPADSASWRPSSRLLGSPGAIDPAPVKLHALFTDGTLRIHFQGEPGQSYRLQESAELGGGAWKNAGTTAAGQDGTAEFSVTPTEVVHWYQVILP